MLSPMPAVADLSQHDRIEHARRVRRMLYGRGAQDLELKVRESVGAMRGDIWKPLDLTANCAHLYGQIAVMYREIP